MVRPTPDRVREALFSILGARCQGAAVLDACAGTGALGIEALSRGAARALFVESDPAVAETLRSNVELVGLAGAEVLVADVLRVAPRLADRGHGPFDLVFVDPPFGEDIAAEVARAIAEGQALAPGALLVIEHPTGAEPVVPHLRRVDQRQYGKVALAFFESE